MCLILHNFDEDIFIFVKLHPHKLIVKPNRVVLVQSVGSNPGQHKTKQKTNRVGSGNL